MSIPYPPFDTKVVREWIAFQRQVSAEWNTAQGNATQISRRVTGLAASSAQYVSIDAPAGLVFVLFARGLNLGEGLYHVDVVSASGGFSGGTPFLKQPLGGGLGRPTVGTNFLAGATPSGTITEITNDVVDNGSGPGGQSVSGSTDVDGVLKFYTGSSAALRITQVEGPALWYYNLDAIGWELGTNA